MAQLALVFPGQASQAIGMGVALRAASPQIDALYRSADEITGLPIGQLCAEGPLEALTRTDVAQVAVVVTSMAAAIWLVETFGRRPDILATAGHSVGELTAMWWAGAISTATTLRLVQERGRLMARDAAACDGTMAAVLGLNEAELTPICHVASQRSGAHVQVANLNAPEQVVLSGDRAAVEIASDLAKAGGARRVLTLAVGGPFHSVYMETAARDFAALVASSTIDRPTVPIILNTTAEASTDPERLREELAVQITQPVRWEDSIRTLASLQCEHILELGPGQVLTGLIRRILPAVTVSAVGTPEAVRAASLLLGTLDA